MPTAARLGAALAFAALGCFGLSGSRSVQDRHAPAHRPGLFQPDQRGDRPFVRLGDHRIMGDLLGRGYQAAMGFGLRTMGQAVLLVVMVFSIYEAALRSAKLHCNGPMEAVLGMFQFALDHLGKMATASVIGTMLHGGILGGVAAERAIRRWK
jgi:hypothetical protein